MDEKIKQYLKKKYEVEIGRAQNEGGWIRLKDAPRIQEPISVFVGDYGKLLINIWPYTGTSPEKSIEMLKETKKLVSDLQKKFDRTPGILVQDAGTPSDPSVIDEYIRDAKHASKKERGGFTDGLI